MHTIAVSDVTMKTAQERGDSIRFRKKLELAKLLDALNVSVIELPQITEPKTDALLIRSVVTAVKHSTVAVPVDPKDPESPAFVWNALKDAAHPRLQVALPVSTVQMEYFYHKKEDAMLTMIAENVAACKALCPEVEFIAQDAGRADKDYLRKAIEAAAGADIITVCDTAGVMLPAEFGAWAGEVKAMLPENIRFGVRCSDALSMADACTVMATAAGADEVKTAVWGGDTANTATVAKILKARGESFGANTVVRTTELTRGAQAARNLLENESVRAAFDTAETEASEETTLTANDDCETVAKAVAALGYELAEEDKIKVFEAFRKIAEKKGGSVGIRELDAIVASAALQVPPAYRVESYLINSGNVITATAHIIISRDGNNIEGLSVGDGPVDAAFRAIEQIIGCHYELDDFQLRAVTEGREAMGEAVVRLRANGKLYSGRGISTDIIGATINAYISAVNKIVYEEVAE
ncbi:MAG: alpha-isopropylmalate synthase regulatory domain-containing protein [Clostridia bacterium]|nr:alpha-isopropylmalate synthase regulatory domain-containing protein [Clostridia bacterium]